MCSSCSVISFWNEQYQLQVHLRAANVVMPHMDLPEGCQADFMEARNAVSDSLLAAAALLRLCIQKLLIHLGGKDESIDDSTAAPIAQGFG